MSSVRAWIPCGTWAPYAEVRVVAGREHEVTQPRELSWCVYWGGGSLEEANTSFLYMHESFLFA